MVESSQLMVEYRWPILCSRVLWFGIDLWISVEGGTRVLTGIVLRGVLLGLSCLGTRQSELSGVW